MRTPGFVTSLKHELGCVAPEYRERIEKVGGLSSNELLKLVGSPSQDPAMTEPVHATDRNVSIMGDIMHCDELVGEHAIKHGEVAFVILAGGAGTRAGGPKAFMKIPHVETSLLAWKLMQGGDMPIWIMTSPDTLQAVGDHISQLSLSPKTSGRIFTQFEGYRLTPDNRISWVNQGVPDLHPLGTGDLGPALLDAKVFDDYPNVKWAYVCNVDNVMADPYDGLVGFHIRHNMPITCEVVDREKEDKGGVLAWVGREGKRLQIVEDWRLPQGFSDAALFHNTNTMLFNVDVLKADVKWRWHRTRKETKGKIVVQHERIIQQYTEEYDTSYVRFPRFGRYAPVKTQEDLALVGQQLRATRFK